MADPILEEIWRVREELIKRHGGLEGYLAYVQKLDRAHRRRGRGSRSQKSGRRPGKQGAGKPGRP